MERILNPIYLYNYIFMYIPYHILTFTYTCTNTNTYAHTNIYIYVYIHIHMQTDLLIDKHIYICANKKIYIYMELNIHHPWSHGCQREQDTSYVYEPFDLVLLGWGFINALLGYYFNTLRNHMPSHVGAEHRWRSLCPRDLPKITSNLPKITSNSLEWTSVKVWKSKATRIQNTHAFWTQNMWWVQKLDCTFFVAAAKDTHRNGIGKRRRLG